MQGHPHFEKRKDEKTSPSLSLFSIPNKVEAIGIK
jgi:hypothetical protein